MLKAHRESAARSNLEKAKYQQLNFMVDEIAACRAEIVLDAFRRFEVEVDALIAKKHGILLPIPLLGNEDNRVLILACALLIFGDETILNRAMEEGEFKLGNSSFGISFSALTSDATVLINERFLSRLAATNLPGVRPISPLVGDLIPLFASRRTDLLRPLLSTSFYFNDPTLRMLRIPDLPDYLKNTDSLRQLEDAAKDLGLCLVTFSDYFGNKFSEDDRLAAGDQVGGLLFRFNRGCAQIPEGSCSSRPVNPGEDMVLANWDCVKEGFWLPHTDNFTDAQPTPSVRRERRRVGKKQIVQLHVCPVRPWDQTLFAEFVMKRTKAIAGLTVATQATLALERGGAAAGNTLSHCEVFAGNVSIVDDGSINPFGARCAWWMASKQFEDHDRMWQDEHHETLEDIICSGLLDSVPKPSEDTAEEAFLQQEVQPFVRDLLVLLRFKACAAPLNASGRTPRDCVGPTNYSDMSVQYKGMLTFDYSNDQTLQLAKWVRDKQDMLDTKLFQLGQVPRRNQAWLRRMHIGVHLFIAAVLFVVYLSAFRVVTPHYVAALLSLAAVAYISWFIETNIIRRGSNEATLRYWNTQLTISIKGYGWLSFLPVVVRTECDALETTLKAQVAVWTTRLLIRNLRRACLQKFITTEDALLQLTDFESILHAPHTSVDSNGMTTVNGTIHDPALCALLDTFLQLPVLSQSEAKGRGYKQRGAEAETTSFKSISDQLRQSAFDAASAQAARDALRMRIELLGSTTQLREGVEEEIQASMEEAKRDKALAKATKRADKLKQDSAASAKEAEEEEALLDALIRENQEAADAAAAAGTARAPAPSPASAPGRRAAGNAKGRPQSTNKTVQAMLAEQSWLLVRSKKHYVYKRTIKGVKQTFTQSKTPSDRGIHNVMRRLGCIVEDQLAMEYPEQQTGRLGLLSST